MVPRRTKLLENHGDVREDAYYWLRDDDRADPDVIAHLEVRLGASPAAGQARDSVSCQGWGRGLGWCTATVTCGQEAGSSGLQIVAP